jgi:hypothetical protein
LSEEEYRAAVVSQVERQPVKPEVAGARTRDIDRVMADQADLVDVLHALRQVLNYKAT